MSVPLSCKLQIILFLSKQHHVSSKHLLNIVFNKGTSINV